jgi:chromosome segregation ATPase
MKIKDVAQLTGYSHQFIYKKIKASGFSLDELKDGTTGHLTTDGEQIVRELFAIPDGASPVVNQDATEMCNQVAELTTEVEKLRNQHATEVETLTGEREALRKQIATLEKEVETLKHQVELLNQQHQVELLNQQIESLTGERDYLRETLDKSQQLQMATLATVKLLPSGERKRRSLWDILRGRGADNAEQGQ